MGLGFSACVCSCAGWHGLHRGHPAIYSRCAIYGNHFSLSSSFSLLCFFATTSIMSMFHLTFGRPVFLSGVRVFPLSFRPLCAALPSTSAVKPRPPGRRQVEVTVVVDGSTAPEELRGNQVPTSLYAVSCTESCIYSRHTYTTQHHLHRRICRVFAMCSQWYEHTVLLFEIPR